MIKFNIRPVHFSDYFWRSILNPKHRDDLILDDLTLIATGSDALRAQAVYNTGSISLASMWILYSVVKYFQPLRIGEIGTFIGNSTLSMAKAMSDYSNEGCIYTCDHSNSINLPSVDRVSITQFKKSTSLDMFRKLSGFLDLIFIDGRISDEDVDFLVKLSNDDTIVVLDDFEGGEKGVANLIKLQSFSKFKNCVVIYPPSLNLISSLSLSLGSSASIAVLIPQKNFRFVRQ